MSVIFPCLLTHTLGRKDCDTRDRLKMMPLHARLQRSDTAAMSQTPPPRARQGRRLSLQPQPTLHPSLSPPSSRLRRSPSPTPPKSRTTASTPTKTPSKLGYKVMMLGAAKVSCQIIWVLFSIPFTNQGCMEKRLTIGNVSMIEEIV